MALASLLRCADAAGAMPTKEEAAQRIFGERAAFYTASKAHTDPQVLARVVELTAPHASGIAWHLATGTGHTALALAPHCRAVIATDLTLPMLAQAVQLRAQQRVTNVRLAVADVHALPFPTAGFDRMTCRRAA